MESSQNKIEKLSDDNFQYWAFQIKALLQSKDLWEVMSTPKPENPGTRPAVAAEGANAEALRLYNEQLASFNEWNIKDGKVMNYIALNVDRSNANLIYHLSSGREAWEALKGHHMTITLGNKMRTKKKLYSLKLEEGASMREHLNTMTELFNKLGDIGDPVPEDQKVTTVLNSIEPEYSALSTAIMAWPEERISMSEVKERLIEEYEKKKEAATVVAKEEGYAAQWKMKYKCHNCHEEGHFRRNCPKLRKEKQDLRWKLNKNRENKANAADEGQQYTNCVFESALRVNEWIVDSGATSHMTSKKNYFSDLCKHRSNVTVANGQVIEVKGIGSVQVSLMSNDGNPQTLTLRNVLWVPELGESLLSVRKLVKEGASITFIGDKVYMKKGEREQLIGMMQDNHYRLSKKKECFNAEVRGTEVEKGFNTNESGTAKQKCVHQWHRDMAHRNLKDIKLMKKQGLKIRSCECTDDCEHCLIGKMARKPFGKSTTEIEQVMDLVVSDVCGYMQVETLSRKRYFVTYIDVHSRYCEVKFIREKSEVPEVTIQFIERMKTQLGKKPKVLRSDRGTEYMDARLQNYLAAEGIKPEFTAGYTPEQNGIAERKNRTLMEAARTMLSESGLPKNHWGEAVSTANYVTNRIVNQSTGKSPYEVMFGKKPRWEELRAFGCDAYVMIPKELRRKLDDKSRKMKFVGYDEQAKAYRMSDGRKVIVSREVRFLTDKCKRKEQATDQSTEREVEANDFGIELDDEDDIAQPRVQEEQIQEEPIQEESDHENDDDFESAEEGEPIQAPAPLPEPRRSARENIGVLPARMQDYVMKTEHQRDPLTYKEAIESRDAREWKGAMQEELESIEENDTWNLVDLPRGRTAIGSKWVFKTKRDSNGTVVKRKARLVAKGFSQKFGVDYNDVFAPVARGTTLRMLLSVAGERKYIVKQYDVKTAFLNGSLSEEIYMKPPPGSQNINGVYKLKKSLYGLKQAARVWNETLHESLVRNGCERNETDNCLYSLTSGGDVVYLLIHVDDILAATNNETMMDKLMKAVGKDFELKCMGEAKEYLGIELQRDEQGNFGISQSANIKAIIDEAGMTNSKPSKFPIDTEYRKLEGKELESNEEYRKLIGMLLYVSTNSRPDIAASIAILSQRVMKPRDTDMNEVKRVIRYLKGTCDAKLWLSSELHRKKMWTFSDADWAEDKQDRKSNSGMIVLLNGGAIAWSCRKQDMVTLSSAEAEYVAITEASKEALWISRVAKHFGIEVEMPLTIFTDSQSAIAMTESQRFSNRTKHIDTKFHFIKDLKEKGIVKLEYFPTSTNIADMLTKPMGGNKIKQLRELGGLYEDTIDVKDNH